jgi:hypothetical protein
MPFDGLLASGGRVPPWFGSLRDQVPPRLESTIVSVFEAAGATPVALSVGETLCGDALADGGLLVNGRVEVVLGIAVVVGGTLA